MEQYTDDERVEDLKKWWAENGGSIVTGLLLGISLIYGWQYWTAYRQGQAENASQAYDALVEAIGKPDIAKTKSQGQTVVDTFPQSIYAALAALRLAQLGVDKGDLATAKDRLTWVIDHAPLDELKDIARLRLARVQLALQQPAMARTLLDAVKTVPFQAEKLAVEGDTYTVEGNAEKARSSYINALAVSGAEKDRDVSRKIDAIAAAEPTDFAPMPPALPPFMGDLPEIPELLPEVLSAPVEPEPFDTEAVIAEWAADQE